MEAKVFVEKPVIFGDFMKMGADKQDRLYEEITDYEKMKSIFQDVILIHFKIKLLILHFFIL